MSLKEKLNHIETLKKESDALSPLKPEREKELWKKFRLEWNYNSNHIEGNTLTYGQTELLLIFNKTTGDHDMREYEEMKAHDVAVKMIDELAHDKEHPLTETFIKKINQVILVRPFWKEAITSDGQPTQRQIIIGDYKKHPNSVRLANGEMFHYASPEETPALMGELMTWYKSAANEKLNPSELAALFHYKFVRIHPFDDGNGRIARLLMNYVLLKNGYPPVIIKSKGKREYLTALNKADTGDLESFVEYIAEQLIWSLELTIKAAKGESLEEDDDLEKEIELLKREKVSDNKLQVKKSREVIQKVYQESLKGLFTEIENQLAKLDDLFFEKDHSYLMQGFIKSANNNMHGKNLRFIEDQIFFDYTKPEKYGYVGNVGYNGNIPNQQLNYPEIFKIQLNYFWKGYKNAGVNAFNSHCHATVEFDDFKYLIKEDGQNDFLLKKLYDEPISKKEAAEVSKVLVRSVLNHIQQNIERAKEK